ncbi:HNH endonuclease [Streptomyces hydrogenans]|uniref:HNH endonuclease n=1 Tax=Streptomyces hydrogenans TaxID=1873719 RepID=UPI00381F6B95
MKREPTRAEREIDSFLSRVSNRQAEWTIKGRQVRLAVNGRLRYEVYASVYEYSTVSDIRLTPQIVFVLRDCTTHRMRVILRALSDYGVITYAKPMHPGSGTAQIGIVSQPFPHGVRGKAIDWVEHTYIQLRPVIDAELDVFTKPAPASSDSAQPAEQAPEKPRPGKLCPVCGQPLPSGYSRHQRCERTVAGAPEPVLPHPPSRYRELVARVEQKEVPGQRTQRTSSVPVRRESAKEAVLERCGGRCENPGCSGMPTDVTDAGNPILEVDHVQPIAEQGRDHPEQMVALCPNCHAIKTRGSTRHELQQTLFKVARTAHRRAMAR